MPSFWNVGAISFSLLAGICQANLLGDTHLLKRYPQAVEVPPAATSLPSTILPGNGSTVGSSIRLLLPTSTRQLVEATTLYSRERSGISTDAATDNSVGDGASDPPSHPTRIISVSSPGGGSTAVTPVEVDWTGLFPVTPSVIQSFRRTTYQSSLENPAATEPSTGTTIDPDIPLHDGSGTATEPSTTEISLRPTSMTLSGTSGTSRGEAESKIPNTAIETETFPSEASQYSKDLTASSFTTLSEESTGTYESTPTTDRSEGDLETTGQPSKAVTPSDETSKTYESFQSATESDATGLESLTAPTYSTDTFQLTTTVEKPDGVTKSDRKSLVSEKTSGSPQQPITTGGQASSTVTSEDGIVTGTDGTVATYVPEQNKDYISSTGTTTTTDDNGAAIVIFPFGWYWKLHDGKGGGGVAKPPAPTANPVPENEPGDKNEDDNDNDDDDDASTKEGDRSAAQSTVLSTTQEPTSAATTTTSEETTSDECTAATQPDCTKTISYMTSDGTQIMTEFGDCPTIVSCATKTQATETVTLTSEFIWAGVPNTNPAVVIPEDAYTADVDPEIVAILEAQWAEIFGDDDGWNDTETATVSGSTTIEESTMTSLTDKEAVSTATSEDSTTTYSDSLTSSTEATATLTTASDTYSVTTVPSTLMTKTRGTSDTTGMPVSTDEEATRTYFPCVIHGGPAVETPYCQCSTTVRGEGYYATTSLVDDQCTAYTEFPSQITEAPETGPITDEPIQQPITTTTDGTVLVWSAYVLDYINIPGITKITQSVGVGEPSTVSTPLPSQTAVDNDGGGQCGTGDGLSKKGLREACDRAISKFEDDTIYSDYASRYSRSTKGILVAASFGQAACIAKFECDDYGIGMKGSDIKEA
ncbi:hypothetical protein J7337_010977 [Fusarium musae]|uniref:Uncharacterized protein n=1 Tax=Fusarium musae TaxID=1042133 RepID=A0A9P8DA39_9HYPO|nr:hypothetical protein J7337_010977 [Fusarium musae]KAG9498086.1 hypothetical protein J7337_010977 [Fusarium musae]